ncbi:MAG: hypothetical protein LBS51_05905 [Oscillospiraceae bacterium]|nr:hypothetical protein [Oscillospiraceae bacterium]
MYQIIVNASALSLPQEIAGKISTGQVAIREVPEGFLIVPMTKYNGKLRGMLKGTGFSTQRYFRQKSADKELEF